MWTSIFHFRHLNSRLVRIFPSQQMDPTVESEKKSGAIEWMLSDWFKKYATKL